MKLEQLRQYKKILIVGYGKEGVATEAYLRKYVPNCELSIADKTDGDDYLNKQYDCDLVIKTPGVPKHLIKVPYTTATNIFFANKGICQVVGITGSKGKSTTASLVYHILKTAGRHVRLIGNIGNPALSELLDKPQDDTIFIYELSSYQLDDIEYSPHICTIVSLFPEHMNYHGSEESYYEAKKRILHKATADDYYVYNPDYPVLCQWAKQTKAMPIPFETDFLPIDTNLVGEHNKSNIRGAISVVRLMGVPDAISTQAVSTFQPLPHRLEYIGKHKDILFYDDAISTTHESTIAALEALPQVSTIFLGGEDRGYKYDQLVQVLAKKNIQNIVLFPESGAKILASLNTIFQTRPNILETRSMEEAVRFAYKYTQKNTICLLSTASPSYSLWKNFEEKGAQYQLYVSQLVNE